MTVYFSTPLTMVDSAIVRSIVDNGPERRMETISVDKYRPAEGFHLVVKNSARGRHVSILFALDKSLGVKVRLIHMLPTNAKNIGIWLVEDRSVVEKTFQLVDAHSIRGIAPELREYLYSGERVDHAAKIEAVERREDLTEDNVLVTRIQRVQLTDGIESTYDLFLEGGKVVRGVKCTIQNFSERTSNPDEPYFYAENIKGDHRLITAQYLNWKFEIVV